MKDFFTYIKPNWLSWLVAIHFFAHTIPMHANVPLLPIKEKIIGIPNRDKKKLKEHSVYQPYSTFLGMPIKKWLYQWGARYFNPDKTAAEINHIKIRYDNSIKMAKDKQAKHKLKQKRNQLIRKKEVAYKQGNRLMRMGEKPLYYKPAYVSRNENIFASYLQAKGYLDATVRSQTEIRNEIAHVTYYIQPNRSYKIDATKLQTNDDTIRKILLEHHATSFIKKGCVYQYQDFIHEQERIVGLLSNNGYFQFNEEYVHFTANVSKEKHTLEITTIVEAPSLKRMHLKVKVDRVVVDLTTNQPQQQKGISPHTENYAGIDFKLSSTHYPLVQIAGKIAIRPGDWYSSQKIFETYEQLRRIALFDSITILPKVEGEDRLVVYIRAIPSKRIGLTVAIGGECIDLEQFHPTLKLTPTFKRAFGGLSILQMDIGIAQHNGHFTAQRNHKLGSLAFNLSTRLKTPHFLGLSTMTNNSLEYMGPQTSLNAGFSTIQEPYQRDKIDIEWCYDWYSRSKIISYQFIPCKITKTYARSMHPLSQQPSQDLHPNSFNTSIGFSAIIRHAFIAPLHYIGQYKWMVSLAIEHGGLYEQLFGIKKLLPSSLQLYHYTKCDADYRHAFRLGGATLLVYQMKAGLISTHDDGLKVPEDKQYSIGGQDSVRGWNNGMIGPGIYNNTHQKKLYDKQKGELLLLGNIEIRQKLIGYLEGALFLDIGNTWKISKYATHAMRFRRNCFYQTFAVGGGVGLRLNFYNTFILCSDIGIKLRQPDGASFGQNKSRLNWVLSIGYPF